MRVDELLTRWRVGPPDWPHRVQLNITTEVDTMVAALEEIMKP